MQEDWKGDEGSSCAISNWKEIAEVRLGTERGRSYRYWCQGYLWLDCESCLSCVLWESGKVWKDFREAKNDPKMELCRPGAKLSLKKPEGEWNRTPCSLHATTN